MAASVTRKTPLIDLRERRGITQSELANALGTTQAYISDLETGKKTPTPPVAERFAQFFGVPVGFIWPVLQSRGIFHG